MLFIICIGIEDAEAALASHNSPKQPDDE